jgi:hypothetical protein
MKSGRETTHGAEGALAAFPDREALLGIACRAHFDGATRCENRIQLFALDGDDFARAFEFDDEHSLAARRIFGMHGGLRGFQVRARP